MSEYCELQFADECQYSDNSRRNAESISCVPEICFTNFLGSSNTADFSPQIFIKIKMKIDKKLLERTAELARLNLTEEEIKKFLPQLKEVFNAFSELDKVDTRNVKPSFQPVELKNVMREDNTDECLTQEEALSNTEHKKDGYFKGPRAV